MVRVAVRGRVRARIGVRFPAKVPGRLESSKPSGKSWRFDDGGPLQRLLSNSVRIVVVRGGILEREGTDMPAKSDVVHSESDILSGTPVFVGTRVPVQSLFDYLEAGDTLDEFLREFPSVSREQAVVALELARDNLLTSARPA
jgi:uncharacterized protein (DUF433 family)